MLRIRRPDLFCTVSGILIFLAAGAAGGSDTVGPALDFPNQSGVARIYSAAGPVNISHPFGQSLGTNQRACIICHSPTDGMSITPSNVRARFDASGGLDPLFRTNDGSGSPDADVSTIEARRAAYSLLLSRGLIRVEMTIPPGAEFMVESVDDPYGYATPARLSLFRRPLPAANLAFLTTVMWDGRETFDGESLRFALARQANNATLGHAQATQALGSAQQTAIVDLETTLFMAQTRDQKAGDLVTDGGSGGPEALAHQEFLPGINSGPETSSVVFTLSFNWGPLFPTSAINDARQSILIGQSIFNTLNLGASGLTCGSCHNVPNVGSNSTGMFFNTGIANPLVRYRDPALPLYTLRCLTTGNVVQVMDPGRALVTGRCDDIGRFKVPILRGLAARAPYFHDGSAATLRAVVQFYNDRFQAGWRTIQIDPLVAFLQAL